MVPVVTIDGPSGSGKGTIALMLADALGWPLLDSGALYRVLAYAAQQAGLPLQQASPELIRLAETLPVSFHTVSGATHAFLTGLDIEREIRTETGGNAASKVAAVPEVRTALLRRQQDMARPPGLVADGRDMGTVVFPHAPAKIFLTASVEERAQRRYKQLKDKGIDANFAALSREIAERDQRDSQRTVAPLEPAADALVLDSSHMTIEQVFNAAMAFVHQRVD